MRPPESSHVRASRGPRWRRSPSRRAAPSGRSTRTSPARKRSSFELLSDRGRHRIAQAAEEVRYGNDTEFASLSAEFWLYAVRNPHVWETVAAASQQHCGRAGAPAPRRPGGRAGRRGLNAATQGETASRGDRGLPGFARGATCFRRLLRVWDGRHRPVRSRPIASHRGRRPPRSPAVRRRGC